MAENGLVLRASDAPIGVLCAEALRYGGGVTIDTSGQAAAIGTASHLIMADVIRQEMVAPPDVSSYCITAGVEKDGFEDVEILTRVGHKHWGKIKSYFPHPFVEEELEVTYDVDGQGVTLRCHADVFGLDSLSNPTTFRVLDWKTGWSTRKINYWAQLLFECVLAARKWPTLERFQFFIDYLREQRAETSVRKTKAWLTIEDVAAFEAKYLEVARRVVSNEKIYRTGGHCENCRRFLECEAQTAVAIQTRRFMETDLAELEDRLKELSPQELVKWRERCGPLEKAVNLVREHAKAACLAAGGFLEGPLTMDLKIIPKKKSTIQTGPAWQLLKDLIEEGILRKEQLTDILEVRKTALEKIVRDNAPNRGKAKAWEFVIQRLKDAEAVEETVSNEARLVKKKRVA